MDDTDGPTAKGRAPGKYVVDWIGGQTRVRAYVHPRNSNAEILVREDGDVVHLTIGWHRLVISPLRRSIDPFDKTLGKDRDAFNHVRSFLDNHDKAALDLIAVQSQVTTSHDYPCRIVGDSGSVTPQNPGKIMFNDHPNPERAGGMTCVVSVPEERGDRVRIRVDDLLDLAVWVEIVLSADLSVRVIREAVARRRAERRRRLPALFKEREAVARRRAERRRRLPAPLQEREAKHGHKAKKRRV